jgi:hypothetical protein
MTLDGYLDGHLNRHLDKHFFDLQFSFAETVRDLSGKSLSAALLEYTNLYARFGFGRGFDPAHEGWQRYLAGLCAAKDGREETYRFYLRNPEANTAPPVIATSGCFSYALRDESFVRLHFRNADTHECSPLARSRTELRRAELAALFAHLRRNVSPETPIVGASWLYNLSSYRRLFPSGYASSGRPIAGGFRSMPLWGQFLDRRGEVRNARSKSFLSALAKASDFSDVPKCFPLQALRVTAPARDFYDFYGV